MSSPIPPVLRALAACIALATAAPQAAAQENEAQEALVESLEEFIAWCQRKRVFVQRNRAYELILEVAPDHRMARRVLGFKKRQGVWVSSGTGREPRNFDRKAALEAPGRLAAAVAPYCDELVARIENDPLTAGESTDLQAQVLRLSPDHWRLRQLRGEIQVEEAWVLKETLAATRRRQELAELIQATLLSVGNSEPGDLSAAESAFGLPFHVAATPEVRVLSTEGPKEARELSRKVRAARRVFERLIGLEVSFPPGCTIYLMTSDGERDAFLARHPGIDEATRLRLSTLAGSGIPGTADWAFWRGDRTKRLDGIVHMAFGYFLAAGPHVPHELAWIQEGLGLYLTKALVGTRLTWFTGMGEGIDAGTGFERRDLLLNPKTNWMREAWHVLSRDPPPKLAGVLAKGPSRLSVDDLLYSYALTAFLLEGRSDDLPRILVRLGRGKPSSEVLEGTLGMDLDRLTLRLRQWVSENFARELAPPLEAARLRAAWAELEDESREDVIASFRARVAALETEQMTTLRELTEPGEEPWPEAGELVYYDPKVHARSDPIRRRWLDPDDPKVKIARRAFLPRRDPRQPILAYAYDWLGRAVVRTGDPDDVETIFENAANGIPPGFDLARAVAIRGLDQAHHEALMAAFAHVYTDRDGGVYPGITLYDAWASGLEMEMPDVDVLGILHDVLNEWEEWVAPLDAALHEPIYRMIEGMYKKARRYRTLREALADCLLLADPWAGRFLAASHNLHAFLEANGSDLSTLAKLLPDGEAHEEWFERWVDACKQDGELYQGGVHRRGRVEADMEAVVAALEDALREEGALD